MMKKAIKNINFFIKEALKKYKDDINSKNCDDGSGALKSMYVPF